MTRRTTNQNMEYLRAPAATRLTSSVLDKGQVTISRITSDTPNHGHVDQHVTEDAFMLALQLRDYHGDLWVDGRNVEFPTSNSGNFTFYDYNRLWQADMKSAFDCVNFHIPRAAILALEEDIGPRPITTFDIKPGADMNDATVRGLAHALLHALSNPAQASRIFVDHVGLALTTHMATTYGEARLPAPVHSGGLAPWQLKRATEMMDARLAGDLSVAEIAGACGLSASYFTRAFKLSTGLPPYRWVLQRRIDVATSLLADTIIPLAEIARFCGFVDQSHFTRVFSNNRHISPGAWRRHLGIKAKEPELEAG